MGLWSFVAGAGVGQAKGLVDAAMDPYQRHYSYGANRQLPNVVPGVPDILDAYVRGFMDEEDARRLLASNGVNWGFRRGFPIQDFQATLDNLTDRWWTIINARGNQLSPVEVQQLLLRGRRTELQAEALLRAGGYFNIDYRRFLLELRHQLPGPSDLVRFALREVWDQPTVDRWGYDAEFPQPFQFWMERQGFSTPTAELYPGMPRELALSWPRAYWRAHWQVPSPTQGYEMLHRLRPNRIGRIKEFLEGQSGIRVDLQPFNVNDLFSILKIADYPLQARSWLAATSASLLTRVDIQRMLDLNLMPRAEVKEQFLDRGYVPEDAERLTQFAESVSRVRRGSRARTDTKREVLSAYRLGIITNEGTMVRLYRMSLTDPLQLELFDQLVPGERDALLTGRIASIERRAGPLPTDPLITLRPIPALAAEVALIDTWWRTRIVGRALTSIRKCYLDGRISAIQLGDRMARLGIVPNRTAQYREVWDLERDCDAKELSTQKIQKLSREGLLTPAEAQRRLTNLGWNDADATLLLAEIQRSVNLDLSRAQAAAARTAGQRQAALERAAKEASRQAAQARRELVKTGTPANLHRWYVLRLIGDDEFVRRLRQLTWPENDIARELQRARIARDKRRERNGQPTSQGEGAAEVGGAGG